MLRLALDARFYGLEHTGLGRYTTNVLTYLPPLLSPHQLIVFVRSPYQHLRFGKGVKTVVVNAPHYSLAEQLALPQALESCRADLLYSFHFNVPLFGKTPFVVTIHDLIKTHFPAPELSSHPRPLYTLKHWGYQQVLAHAVNSSLHIIVPTNTVKNDLLAHYPLNPEKIRAIAEAPDPHLKPSNRQPNLVVPAHYLLYVGNAYPHKNLPTLLQAFLALTPKFPDLRLILVAHDNPYLTSLLSTFPQDLIDRLLLYSNLTDSQLSYLYTHAASTVMPSFMEGFGLPGIESLRLGTPLVASDIPVFREVYQDHATYFDPHNFASLVTSLIRVMRRPRPQPLPLKRSWRTVAQEVAEVIHASCARL